MSRHRILLVVSACWMFSLLTFSGSAVAQSSTLTFSSQVQLPGIVLSAGKYHFALDNNNGGVVVSDERGRFVATLHATPVRRSASGSIVVMRQSIAGAAPEIAAWYSSGGKEGLGFLYPQLKK